MAQTYKMMLGTSGKQWEQLTVKDDGTMMLYFHGTDRSVTQQVTAITEGEWKGWLRSEKGSMFPGLESGKWNKMEDVVETTESAEPEVIEENTDSCVPMVASDQRSSGTNYTNNEPVIVNPAPLTLNQPQPRPRRQRKQRKPRVERQEPLTNNREPLTVRSALPLCPAKNHQSSSTMKAIGMVAAATVALFVIYETGLLIPLGLIGLATGGILK